MDYINRLLHRNSPNTSCPASPEPGSGNEASSLKGEQQQQHQQQHDVKVRFIREFADAGSTGRDTIAESSLSSASSFQSLTSTLSSKCSSGICVDSSPGKASDTSYLSADIPGLDDLISACENIRLNDTTVDLSKDQSFTLQLDGEDFNGDQTFTSATDRTSLDRTRDLSRTNSPSNLTEEIAHFANVTCELDKTRELDSETEASLANAERECDNPDIHENTRHRVDSNLATSVDETFVQCTSNLVAQDTPVVSLNGADAELIDAAKTENSQDTSEKPVENNIHEIPNDILVNRVDEFETLIPVELVDKLPLEIALQSEEIKRSILDETVELSAPEFFEEAKSFAQPDETNEISAPEFFEEAKSFVQPDETNEISAPEFIDEGKNSLQLDETIELRKSQFFDFADKTPASLESLLDVTVDEAARLETLSSFKPASLSDIEEISQFSTLPSLATLSSVCLPIEISEIDASLTKEVTEEIESQEDAIVTADEAAVSLSEKFAQIVAEIAKNDLCTGTSVSAINEPTFLDSQTFVDASAEIKDKQANEKTEDTSVPREQNSIEQIAEIQSRDLEIDTADIATVTIDEISKVSKKQTIDVEHSSPIKAEVEALPARAIDVEVVEKSNIFAFVDKRDTDSSGGSEDLNTTVTIQDISAGNLFSVPESDQYAEFLPQQQSTALVLDRQPIDLNKTGPLTGTSLLSDDNSVSPPIALLTDEYAAFLPQKQSTSLATCFGDTLNKLERQPTPFVTALPPLSEPPFNGEIKKSPKIPEIVDNRCNFAKLELAANAVANDIYNKSLEIEEENDRFVTATCTELFTDPGGFDFLLSKTPRKNSNRNLRTESLYIKFDPLVSNTSMLPQGNIQTPSPPANEERNGENNTTIPNLGTPKRNPALAAIDRLLFYSPMANTPPTNTATIQKTNDAQEKVEPTEETSAETVNMAKELELVRSTVIQLEEQLEKLKIDNEEKQTSYQEKINQLQAQLAQEIKNKNQITVVVDEYEKSISRLVAERERDRKNLDLEKAKLQEELAAAKHHLDNTEAAFNDVHLKYERLKAVVNTYKSNEAALKESLQENVEIIKSLENRYEQVKSHATVRLEKANQDLDTIRKRNESETVRLHAMLRKAELKSNSLAELVEQKTKENKELTQILDEVIARVGRNKSE